MRNNKTLVVGALAALALFAVAGEAAAQSAVSLTSKPAAGGGQVWSVPIQTLVTLTALTFLPAVMLLMTGFTRIVIVLSLLRQALGTQASPPNQVVPTPRVNPRPRPSSALTRGRTASNDPAGCT